jgi:hypothetical protein
LPGTRMEYYDTGARQRRLLVSAVPQGVAAAFAATARFASVRNWTARRY